MKTDSRSKQTQWLDTDHNESHRKKRKRPFPKLNTTQHCGLMSNLTKNGHFRNGLLSQWMKKQNFT